MSEQEMPSSFYAILVSFAIFFGCLNIYILTTWLDHPLASPLWLVGTIIGVFLLIYSIYMMRRQQREIVMKKQDVPAK